jgi:hypothetical protein
VVCDTTLKVATDPILDPSSVCSGHGLFVKSNVALNVNGTLRGSTDSGETCGINLSSDENATGITITRGRIVGFRFGICFMEQRTLLDSNLTRLTILNPSQNCIGLFDDGDGIPSFNEISQVYCEGAGEHGIVVEGSLYTIERVTSVRNGGSGFFLRVPFDGFAGTLRKSVSLHNKGDGLTIAACNLDPISNEGFTITNNSFSENEGFGIQDPKLPGEECRTSNYTNNTCVKNDDGPYTDPPGPCL